MEWQQLKSLDNGFLSEEDTKMKRINVNKCKTKDGLAHKLDCLSVRAQIPMESPSSPM